MFDLLLCLCVACTFLIAEQGIAPTQKILLLLTSATLSDFGRFCKTCIRDTFRNFLRHLIFHENKVDLGKQICFAIDDLRL